MCSEGEIKRRAYRIYKHRKETGQSGDMLSDYFQAKSEAKKEEEIKENWITESVGE